jgi:hypothetical protein
VTEAVLLVTVEEQDQAGVGKDGVTIDMPMEQAVQRQDEPRMGL